MSTMWSKLAHPFKNKQDDELPSSSSASTSQGDVMTRVLEQHPNLSVFHPDNHSPPSSPSKKKSMFKRLSRNPLHEEQPRPPSPTKSIMQKVKSTFNSTANNSQLSLARIPSHNSAVLMASSSQDNSVRQPSSTRLRRASVDMLRTSPPQPASDYGRPSTPVHSFDNVDPKGSVRSILRPANTPGTGQNVRFFSRDAYKLISPNQSTEIDQQALTGLFNTAPRSAPLRADGSFTQQQQELPSIAALSSSSSSSTKSRPPLAGVFSPLQQEPAPKTPQPAVNNSFDLNDIDIPSFPPGLGFDLDIPSLDDGSFGAHDGPVSSTPFRDSKGKGKEKQASSLQENSKENVPVTLKQQPIDENIFHAQEKPARLPSGLHDRSNSFSFGQTMFFSMEHSPLKAEVSPLMIESNRSSQASVVPSVSTSSSEMRNSPISHKSSIRTTDSPASSTSKSRSRALSDTVFHSMLRSASRLGNSSSSANNNNAEADINDESSTDLVVYSQAAPEPDPFRADANTYYTPQTMIPITPPRASNKAPSVISTSSMSHARRASKEESLIYSLQAQLTVQSELVGQYETDLRARDELVELLGQKLSGLEREDGKRRGALRAWKKKVSELEKLCRYLEDEVEGSRQESMERSVMDEASGEALRMLHRQIAQLEREKGDWLRREDVLREEVDKLDVAVKEKNEELNKLQTVLSSRDERERELKAGIKEAKEQMEMMGNISMPVIDEEVLRDIAAAAQNTRAHEDSSHHVAEWEEERDELVMSIENVRSEKNKLQLELATLSQQLMERDDELKMLKNELEAQWSLTEESSVKLEALEQERRTLELDSETQKNIIQELEERLNSMEAEWNADEDKKIELENEIQELWATNQELESERAALQEQLRREQDQVDELNAIIVQRDAQLEDSDKERQFALETIQRLEGKLQRRDAEAEEFAQQILERETEAERLREEMNSMRREHARAIDEQTRALQDVAAQQGEEKMQVEIALKHKAEADLEARMARERIMSLTEEMEKLRRQVHELQQESADKEVKLVHANKQFAQAQEDNHGLNIALDSKQQELELLKRKHNVRGTAGATPAQLSKAAHRRDSSVFTTPTMSRPSSVVSDSGKEDNTGPVSTSIKVGALGRSSRLNATATTPSTAKSVMGPPSMKPSRPSIATPTPAARQPSMTRSASAKPTPSTPSTATPQLRRASSASETPQQSMKTKLARAALRSPSPVPDEKENYDAPSKVKRRSMIPTPA